MKRKSLQFGVLFGSIGLFLFGLFYHITSSEFWPMTISKRWWDLPHFEYSLLQKPFFSLFLALFHLFPLDDSSHILAVKLVFSLLGLISLYLWGTAAQNHPGGLQGYALALLLVILSPLLLHNFFRIRSDQMTFLFFALALWFRYLRKPIFSLAALFLMLTISVKSVMLFIPSLGLFYFELRFFWQSLNRKNKFFIFLALLGALVWMVAFNIGSFLYLLNTFSSAHAYRHMYRNYLLSEWPLLLLSGFSCFILLRKAPYRKNVIFSAAIALLVVLIWPQPLPYFVASLFFIIYFPALLLFFEPAFSKQKKRLVFAVVFAIQLLNLLSFYHLQKQTFYLSNHLQLQYISRLSALLEAQNLTYLDGMGVFPRQKIISCFISPDDEDSNNYCWSKISSQEADSYLITQRLSYLGAPLFKMIEPDYEQVRPNFWLRKEIAEKLTPAEKNLSADDGLPILMFGFD